MYQIISYMIYLLVSSFITFYVGWKCYDYGFVYLKYLVKDIQLCKAINKILLSGYYLVNIGYITWSLNSREIIESFMGALHWVGGRIGIIMLILCILHYINMTTIYILSQKHILHAKN